MQSMLNCSDLSARTRDCSRKIESIGGCDFPETGEEMMVYVKWVGESTSTWELLRHIPFYLQNMYTHVRYINAYTNNTTFSEIQRIADARYDKYNRINVLLYFVGNMQPSWEFIEYIIENGVNQSFRIKQSGPNPGSEENQAEPEVDDSHPKFETRPLCTVS